MKTLLPFLLFCIVNITIAQQKTGILTYTVPSNWQLKNQNTEVLIEKSKIAKNESVSSIEILATENKTVNNEKIFLSLLTTKKGSNVTYDVNTIKKTEENGTICYAIKGKVVINLKEIDCFFYSLSNGSQTSFIRFTKGISEATIGFQQFWSSLLVDAQEIMTAPHAKRKEPRNPPSGAAPAPMM